MNDVSLNPEIIELEAEMEYEMPQYPVIPNPEGEPTEEITKMEIDDVIYEVTDAEARATLPTKVDKVEGKGLSTNDYTDTDKAIVDGVTSALDGKVDKVAGKGLSTNDFTDEEKTIVDETPSALDNKVDKVNGKGLSENDFTDTLKTKLDGIEAEANKTVVDNSVTSTSTNPVESKAIYNLLNDLLPEATATGNPIAITNASGFNAKSLKVELEPIQDLHGYDSPWVGGGGKNKFHNVVSSQTVNGITITVYDDGTFKANGKPTISTFILSLGTVSLKSNNTYIISGSPEGGGSSSYRLDGRKDNVTINNWNDATNDSFTAEEDIEATICLRISGDYTCNNLLFKPMICLSTATNPREFAPYSNICPISGRTQTTVSVNSEDTTIQFGQTVYGGEVDVTSGGTSDEWNLADLGLMDWVYDSSVPRFYTQNIKDIVEKPSANTQVADFLAVCYKTLALNDIYLPDKDSVCAVSTGGVLSIIDKRYSNKDTFKQAMSGVKVCYKKATPTTINTPANEISLNKANNTLTADGDMELIYSKIPQ